MSKIEFDVNVEQIRLEQGGEHHRVFLSKDRKFTAKSRSLVFETLKLSKPVFILGVTIFLNKYFLGLNYSAF